MNAEPVVRSATLRGASVGGFVLESRLGGGGGGAVWRARGAGGEAVAVKLLHVPLASVEARRRFARERDTLERLAPHPAIVPLVASGVDADGVGWLATPLHAASLAERLASVDTLVPKDVLRVGLRLAAALAHAHACGVVHGDVKPANVLLDARGRALLGDFGASVLEDATLTQACGLSLDWAAPERLAGAPPSVAADLFGLGATLARARAGAGADPRRETPIAGAPTDTADELDALIAELTRIDPQTRPGTAADVHARLAMLSADEVDVRTEDPRGHRPNELEGAARSDASVADIGADVPPVRGERADARPAGGGALDDTRESRSPTAVPPESGLAVLTTFETTLRTAARSGTEPVRADTIRRSGAGQPRARSIAVALCGGALALGFALGRDRPPAAATVGGTLDCPPGAYLCERFDAGPGRWADGGESDVARFAIESRTGSFGADGALVRVAGPAAEHGTARFSHPIAAPPPGSTLRLRTRLVIDRDLAGAPNVWLHLLHLHAPNGQVWAVTAAGYGPGGMSIDGSYYDAGGPNDTKFESGMPLRVDRPFCLEAIVRPDGDDDGPELAVYVDGAFVGSLEHSTPPPARPWVDRYEVYLGGPGVDPPRDAPEIVFDELVIDAGDAPAC